MNSNTFTIIADRTIQFKINDYCTTLSHQEAWSLYYQLGIALFASQNNTPNIPYTPSVPSTTGVDPLSSGNKILFGNGTVITS